MEKGLSSALALTIENAVLISEMLEVSIRVYFDADTPDSWTRQTIYLKTELERLAKLADRLAAAIA